MSKVYLVSAKRSAIGSMLGSLKEMSPCISWRTGS